MSFRILVCNMLWPNMFIMLVLFLSTLVCSATASVSYDHRAIIVGGKRRILISGSIHYPRSTPEVLLLSSYMPMWFTGSCCFLFVLFFMCFLSMGLCGVLVICRFFSSKFLTFCGILFVVADVAWSYTEGQRWRLGCYSDICVLEWTRTFSWKSTSSNAF